MQKFEKWHKTCDKEVEDIPRENKACYEFHIKHISK